VGDDNAAIGHCGERSTESSWAHWVGGVATCPRYSGDGEGAGARWSGNSSSSHDGGGEGEAIAQVGIGGRGGDGDGWSQTRDGDNSWGDRTEVGVVVISSVGDRSAIGASSCHRDRAGVAGGDGRDRWTCWVGATGDRSAWTSQRPGRSAGRCHRSSSSGDGAGEDDDLTASAGGLNSSNGEGWRILINMDRCNSRAH